MPNVANYIDAFVKSLFTAYTKPTYLMRIGDMHYEKPIQYTSDKKSNQFNFK